MKWMEFCLRSSMCSDCGELMSACFEFSALLTVSEEVRSRCSLKHRKSLLLTDVSMENVPMDTYPIHHSDTSYRLVVWLLDVIQSSMSVCCSKLSEGNCGILKTEPRFIKWRWSSLISSRPICCWYWDVMTQSHGEIRVPNSYRFNVEIGKAISELSCSEVLILE